MAMGGSALGIAYFAGIKLAGYSLAGRYINRSEQLARPPALAFGAVRAAIGVAIGISYALALAQLRISHEEWTFYAGLVPVRIAEWAAVLWLFYRSSVWLGVRRWRYIGLGVLWSYGLDLPAALAAFVLPGGFWVC